MIGSCGIVSWKRFFWDGLFSEGGGDVAGRGDGGQYKGQHLCISLLSNFGMRYATCI
jgi:hypothetical protein